MSEPVKLRECPVCGGPMETDSISGFVGCGNRHCALYDYWIPMMEAQAHRHYDAKIEELRGLVRELATRYEGANEYLASCPGTDVCTCVQDRALLARARAAVEMPHDHQPSVTSGGQVVNDPRTLLQQPEVIELLKLARQIAVALEKEVKE